MPYSVDRIEDDFAVLISETGQVSTASTVLFDVPPREGDLVESAEYGWVVRDDLTRKERARVHQLLKELLNNE